MTAVTRAGTLSRVMTSWGGTSIVTVLRSTLTILFTNGINKNSPGPLAPPWTRPRRKMTPRSYSLTIFTALIRIPATKIAIITITIAEKPKVAACNNTKLTSIIGFLPLRRPGGWGAVPTYRGRAGSGPVLLRDVYVARNDCRVLLSEGNVCSSEHTVLWCTASALGEAHGDLQVPGCDDLLHPSWGRGQPPMRFGRRSRGDS